MSDDNQSYRPLRAGENNDSGCWFIYEFNKPVSVHFLKFTLVDKFPDDGYTWTLNRLEFDELRAGRLVPPQLHDAQGDSESCESCRYLFSLCFCGCPLSQPDLLRRGPLQERLQVHGGLGLHGWWVQEYGCTNRLSGG